MSYVEVNVVPHVAGMSEDGRFWVSSRFQVFL